MRLFAKIAQVRAIETASIHAVPAFYDTVVLGMERLKKKYDGRDRYGTRKQAFALRDGRVRIADFALVILCSRYLQ
jgi:hypothetical protein